MVAQMSEKWEMVQEDRERTLGYFLAAIALNTYVLADTSVSARLMINP